MGPSFLKAKGYTSALHSFETLTNNPNVNRAQANGTYPILLTNFPQEPIQTLQLSIGNPGPLPKWRGVAGEGWLFIDEIEVYGHEK